MRTRKAQYYRPPRRVPRSESEPSTSRNRTRDIILLFAILIVASLLLFGVSFFLTIRGLPIIALGVYMLGVILVFVSIGVGFAVGLTYFMMKSFLKREFKKRFDRMDQERHARYRKMMGHDTADDKEKK
ncbi:MAG: hypothetical protein ACXADB_09345 [Candidatus Hermodarchaeia archaeon]